MWSMGLLLEHRAIKRVHIKVWDTHNKNNTHGLDLYIIKYKENNNACLSCFPFLKRYSWTLMLSTLSIAHLLLISNNVNLCFVKGSYMLHVYRLISPSVIDYVWTEPTQIAWIFAAQFPITKGLYACFYLTSTIFTMFVFIHDFQTVEFIEFPLINVRDLIFYKYAESVIDKVKEACSFDGTFFGPKRCLWLTNVCTWEMQCIEHRLQRCFPSVIPSVRITCNSCLEGLVLGCWPHHVNGIPEWAETSFK